MSRKGTPPQAAGNLIRTGLLALSGLWWPAIAVGADSLSETPIVYRVPPPPPVDARSVAIIDYAQGETLYALNQNETIPPASLTKLMTMHVALKAVEAGTIDLFKPIEILPEETRLPRRSTLMYLGPGMKVNLDDLLRGMAVVSGNDAAMVVARAVAGGTDAFAALMNAQARALGLGSTRFVEPSGLSEENLSTAGELAAFARSYLIEHPESLEAYHSRLSMEFPKQENMPPGAKAPNPAVILRNKNNLLFYYEGCDGLKTGYIDESGSNLIATAKRGDTRIIVVTLGGTNGSAARQRGAAKLLDWAFANWKTVSLPVPALQELRVYGGAERSIAPVVVDDTSVTIPSHIEGDMAVRIELPAELEAPLAAGQVLGKLIYTKGGTVLRRIDLVSPKEVPQGSFLRRLWDALSRFFSKLFSGGS